MTNEKPYMLRKFEEYVACVYHKDISKDQYHHLVRAYAVGALTMARLQNDIVHGEMDEMAEIVGIPTTKETTKETA